MQPLTLEASRSTPKVDFDPDTNSLSIAGQSYPENAFEFYRPLFEWIDRYINQLETQATVTIDFTLAYINTSSSKCIMMLLDKFEQAYAENKDVVLKWYCDPENEHELECAEEFTEDLKMPFEIIPLPPHDVKA